ncbi:hypothetical protein UFOVP1261_2 [uncultured Caudovirales phage]|uniref:Uncharacterized protein n=1 Tax=uncultured Caudovirales phage TaxID=2100421 RepID=A0A6J5T546_9CAUD|nr:hypothetical protein UFOVP1261_2 [uncultured Caudovirales phage]CAB4221964.1 hypothetical protein UFOVP1650_16 [uncultured Caudovirales phage]
MSQWEPVWRVKIDGVSYTSVILANLAIVSGRRTIYEQAQAGYVSIELIETSQATIPVFINSTITVEIQNTSSTWIPIFGGNVSDVDLAIRDVGSIMFTQTYTIIALGALARLQKALTDGVLAKAHDGTQISVLLQDLLLQTWGEVPAALAWNTYDLTGDWANAGNIGLGEIDVPGDYELANRASSVNDFYSIVSALATSGLGYIYEDGQGRISYADSTRRSQYLSANGYVNLTANQARANGLKQTTRAGDVRNYVTIKYGSTGSSETTASDAESILQYGTLAQVIDTTIFSGTDAAAQAAFYLAIRKTPQPIFAEITFDLTNPELDNADRDALIGVFMGMPISLADLPPNMGSIFQGFVEGWSFRAGYKRLSITMTVSPVAYSLQSLEWGEISSSYLWSGVSPTLDWARATIIT